MLARLCRGDVGFDKLLMDLVDSATRSRIMRAVPQKDTVPELVLRRELHRMGLRYRLHSKALPGKPDIVFPSARVAVFVHGCFWHRHLGCRLTTTPRSREDFWQEKFAANQARDRRNEEQLRELGWAPVVVWQCEIQGYLPKVVAKVKHSLERR